MSGFQKLGLDSSIIMALNDLGYEQPTPIQELTIPHLLTADQDLKAFAQTGTGKTAAFSLPILNNLEVNTKSTQALILSPTRELGIQIAKNMVDFAKYKEGIDITAVYGGAPIEQQIKAIRKGAHVIVGTPGRTLDLIKRKVLRLDSIKWLVLDEADEMLNMGFKEELDGILKATPESKQSLLFSATFPKEVEAISKNYLHAPIELSAGQKNIGSTNVTHEYYLVADRNRYAALKRIADLHPHIYSIVFCRTRRETKDVADKLIADGYNADALHGDLTQAQRDSVMQKFRQKHIQILVATDVAARGLDVDNLSHVINYKLPDQIENYTHRSGRTGRAGKTGVSIALITAKEKSRLKPIEKKIKKEFVAKPIPNGKEICESQLFHLIDKVHDIEVNDKEIGNYLPSIYKKLEGLDRESLIQRFVSIEFNQFLSYYENAPDLNSDGSDRKPRSSSEFSRFYINQGKMDKLIPSRLIGFINEQLKRRDIEIGRIEILKSFSFFEVDKAYEEEILERLNGEVFNKRRVIVEPTTAPKSKKKSKGFGKRNSKGYSKRKHDRRKKRR